ncbi:DUF3152 domain-containing protein [Nocardioides dongkuii]|uniref:DUF3152 domain-containing protein n=1 Tax=Nocardioides dongkuii TaxID=2760089 RepID=UPI0015FC6AF2|nr:DUF3152 domain-containing protein [Nocardioides dongkuii]
MGLRALALSLAVAAGLLVPAAPASAVVVNTAPPVVSGSPEHGGTLRAGRGSWAPAPTAYSFQWLRDGSPVRGATDRRYRLGLDDLGARLAVTVTATDSVGDSASATSAATAPVRRARLANRRPPTIDGELRFGRIVTARPGRWSTRPARVRYQWLRGARPIRGATGARYAVAPADVGRRLRVRVEVRAPGHRPAERLSVRREAVRHRVDVRRTVTYRVETRGRVTASVRQFRRLVQQTYDHPRGWRGAGVRFRPVARGGQISVVLAEASRVPDFSPVCSSTWSCRVGRYVIINQDRWKHASPAWNAANGALRGYRHMVVNHETGHWLGFGHAGCPGRGRPAPVMMQQSKGLDGCRFNPFPTLGELGRAR